MTRILTLMALLYAAPVVFAHEDAMLRFQDAAERPLVERDAPPAPYTVSDHLTPDGARRGFLDKGTRRWSVNLAYADDLIDNEEIQASVAYHAFIEQRVEVVVDFAVRNLNQIGENAVGFNPSLAFRWHFWTSDADATWTAFMEVGIGVMGSTSDVPEDGTSFNFTPRAGVGLTWQCLERARLVASLRWSHISNGRIYGADDNPGIDSPMLHLGVIFAF